MIFSGDVLLLGALTGPREVGYYSIAKKLAFAVLRLTDPLQMAIFPQLATLVAKRDLGSVSVMVKKISGMLGGLMAGLFVAAAALSSWLMTVIYGPEFREAGTAFAILVVAAGTGAALFWSTSLIVSLGRVDARLKAYLAALGLSAPLAWFLVPELGATGLAIGMLAAVVTMQAILVTACMTELRR
jgi:O-antigen/teichoic acid export membrane protein